MKIAVSSTGPDIYSSVDPRFGRCQYFVIVDLEDMSFEAVPNTAGASQGGAGIQSAKLVVDKGAEAILTGRVGPKAYEVLSHADLDVITCVSGMVRDAARHYKQGALKPGLEAGLENDSSAEIVESRVQPKTKSQVSITGVGGGRGMNAATAKPSGNMNTRQEELVELNENVRKLAEQMEGIQKRMRELENRKLQDKI